MSTSVTHAAIESATARYSVAVLSAAALKALLPVLAIAIALALAGAVADLLSPWVIPALLLAAGAKLEADRWIRSPGSALLRD